LNNSSNCVSLLGHVPWQVYYSMPTMHDIHMEVKIGTITIRRNAEEHKEHVR